MTRCPEEGANGGAYEHRHFSDFDCFLLWFVVLLASSYHRLQEQHSLLLYVDQQTASRLLLTLVGHRKTSIDVPFLTKRSNTRSPRHLKKKEAKNESTSHTPTEHNEDKKRSKRRHAHNGLAGIAAISSQPVRDSVSHLNPPSSTP